MRPCPVPGCGVLVVRGRCPAHAVAFEHGRRNYDQRTWYRTARWYHLAARVKREQAFACASCGRPTSRLEVDHIVPHGGDVKAFYDRTGLQALCVRCHHLKTARGL